LPSPFRKPTFVSVRWSLWIRLLALVVWLPATSHCRLAALPSFSFLACAHDDSTTHAEPVDDGDGCSSVESASYRSEEAFDLAGPPELRLDPSSLSCGERLRIVPIPGSDPSAEPRPPPLSSAWQFLLRAAGNPRAPSVRP
jgi:hypothetical protein